MRIYRLKAIQYIFQGERELNKKEGSQKIGIYFLKQIIWKSLFLLLMIGVFLGLVWLFPVNTTESMPFGIYMRLPKGDLKAGDLIELDNPLPVGSFGVNVKKGLLKKIDHIEEDGKYWVLGDHELSYDSRYFGAVDESLIKHRLKPIWVSKELPEIMKKDMYSFENTYEE